MRKNMTLPLAFHAFSALVEGKLAEAVEGAVCLVALIFRMFESNVPRLFLKFERFSSLKKCCRGAALRGNAATTRAMWPDCGIARLAGAVIRQHTVHHPRRFGAPPSPYWPVPTIGSGAPRFPLAFA
jgi:hypothetical protein